PRPCPKRPSEGPDRVGGLQPLSARNPRVKRLARLARQRSERDADRLFLAEGPVLVTEAASAGLTIDEVFVEAEAHQRPEIAALAVASGASGSLVEGSLRGQADTVTPNGLVAIAHRPPEATVLAEPVMAAAGSSLVLVLAGVADPGNVGTLVRVAEATGAVAVV